MFGKHQHSFFIPFREALLLNPCSIFNILLFLDIKLPPRRHWLCSFFAHSFTCSPITLYLKHTSSSQSTFFFNWTKNFIHKVTSPTQTGSQLMSSSKAWNKDTFLQKALHFNCSNTLDGNFSRRQITLKFVSLENSHENRSVYFLQPSVWVNTLGIFSNGEVLSCKDKKFQCIQWDRTDFCFCNMDQAPWFWLKRMPSGQRRSEWLRADFLRQPLILFRAVTASPSWKKTFYYILELIIEEQLGKWHCSTSLQTCGDNTKHLRAV